MFTPLERDVLEYAEAMTQTPPTVTDEMSARLLEALGPAALVELTAFVALANHGTHQHRARHRITGLRDGVWPRAPRRTHDDMSDVEISADVVRQNEFVAAVAGSCDGQVRAAA